MRISLLISSALCLLLAGFANAQSNTKTQYISPVTKGYYSIGRNAEKLNNGALQMVQSSTYYTAQKGYYTITEKRYKLPKFYRVNVPVTRPKTSVKKGYYNIGQNAEKL